MYGAWRSLYSNTGARLVSARYYGFGTMAAVWLALLAEQPHQPGGFLPSALMQLGHIARVRGVPVGGAD